MSSDRVIQAPTIEESLTLDTDCLRANLPAPPKSLGKRIKTSTRLKEASKVILLLNHKAVLLCVVPPHSVQQATRPCFTLETFSNQDSSHDGAQSPFQVTI